MNDGVFEVGLTVSLETEFKYYLSTRIIGWERNLFLITGIVHSSGKIGRLKVNDPCKIRFLKEGIAYGFETTILYITLYPYPLMFFKYPQAIEKFKVRKFNRIKSNIAAQLMDPNGTFIADATIRDISEGGCGLTISGEQGNKLAQEHEYLVSFTILETNLRLRGAIRKIKIGRDIRCLGIEFQGVTPEQKEQINIFSEICTDVLTSKIDLLLTKMKTSGDALSGHLEELPVTDILQILDQMGKEGVLHIITKPHNGYIAIGKGQIMDVFMDDIQGEDALAELLSIKAGLFHFNPKEIPPGRFKRPTNLALMDTCRLLDERESIQDIFPGNTDTLLFVKDPNIEDIETETIVKAFQNGASNIPALSAATGLSMIRSALISARLLKGGFLMKTD